MPLALPCGKCGFTMLQYHAKAIRGRIKEMELVWRCDVCGHSNREIYIRGSEIGKAKLLR